jgi:hypothetical protein
VITPDAVHHIWLFGSHARGDFDPHSDVDILFVGSIECTDYVEIFLEKKFGYPLNKCDICFYTWQGIDKLISSGSLFGWHLLLEGRPLFDKSGLLRERLSTIPRYANHIADIRTLITCTQDCILNLKLSKDSLEFDAGVLATSSRNTGIILSNYINKADFSQNAPFFVETNNKALKFPLSRAAYNRLLSCRHASERGEFTKGLKINDEWVIKQAKEILRWQECCLRFIEETGVGYASIH